MIIQCKYDELVNVDELKPYPKNRNKHSPEQIERLSKILIYQGVRAPIVVSKLSGSIVKGHGTLEAIKKNSWLKAPIVYQDFETLEQEYAFVQSDNAIASWAELDLSGINSDLGDLGPDFDIDLLGIEDFVLEPADKEAGCDEDEVPEPKEAKSVLGDIYILGNHRLMCGDSTSIDAVEKLMDGQKADMVFTDPPYGMNLDATYSNMAKNSSKYKTKRTPYSNIIGDDQEFNPDIVLGPFDYCSEIFLWGADYYCSLLPKNGSWVVWDKREDKEKGINTDGMFGSSFELCWSKTKHSRDIARFILSGGYMNKNDKQDFRVHPTQKPVNLIQWFFDRWEKTKGLVVDIYGGSGSTLIACEKTGRKCFMMELDPHYCDVIVSRFCKFTNTTKVIRNGEEIEWVV